MRKATKVEIKTNMDELCTYSDLREYLDKRINRLLRCNTSRSNTELWKLKELRDILDLCAVLCNYNEGILDPDDLYSHLS
jgi:hypothetical protein